MFMWIIFMNLYYIFNFLIKKESVSWIYWHNSYNCWFINERIVIQNICQLCRVLSVLDLTALMVLLLVTRAHFWAWYSKTHITCQQPAIRLLHYLSYIYWLKHHMVSYFDKGFILQWKPSLKTKPTFKPTHSSLKYIYGKPNLVWSFHDFITNFRLLFMKVMSYVRSMFSKKKLKVLIFKVRKKPKL